MHAMSGMEDVEKLSAGDGGFKAYRQLKDEGTIRNIGFSFHVDWSPGIREAVERFDPDVIMCALNAAKTPDSNAGVGNEEELLPLAQERNIGIVAMKVTGQNRLIGNVNGQDLLRYTLSLPVVTLANVGMDGFGTLESCVAVAKEPPLSADQRQAIHVALDYKADTHRLAYFEPDYVDGESLT
jgi:predicted aldo/keto reductase-like oxidoreductase